MSTSEHNSLLKVYDGNRASAINCDVRSDVFQTGPGERGDSALRSGASDERIKIVLANLVSEERVRAVVRCELPGHWRELRGSVRNRAVGRVRGNIACILQLINRHVVVAVRVLDEE